VRRRPEFMYWLEALLPWKALLEQERQRSSKGGFWSSKSRGRM
jgi:hypothetical protein